MDDREPSRGIVEAPVRTDAIRKVYNLLSKVYWPVAVLESRARMRGLELARVLPDDAILEVAPGLGLTFVEILKRVKVANVVYGVDLSPEMLRKTRDRVIRHGYANFDLREADARCLPFDDATFDVVYCSYMLDLIPLAGLPGVVSEFYRVLKEGGRVVLVNMSKKGPVPVLYEKLYRAVPYLCGGCRPVLMEPYLRKAGFSGVKREYLRLPFATEIVAAVRSALTIS